VSGGVPVGMGAAGIRGRGYVPRGGRGVPMGMGMGRGGMFVGPDGGRCHFILSLLFSKDAICMSI
jgi:hypothetical protein